MVDKVPRFSVLGSSLGLNDFGDFGTGKFDEKIKRSCIASRKAVYFSFNIESSFLRWTTAIRTSCIVTRVVYLYLGSSFCQIKVVIPNRIGIG